MMKDRIIPAKQENYRNTKIDSLLFIFSAFDTFDTRNPKAQSIGPINTEVK